MVANYLHGIETIETDAGSYPVTTVLSSVIGLIGTAPGADPTLFPLNTPVALFADPITASKLGTDGTLLDAVNAIYAQGSAVVVVVRVAQGTTQEQTWSNIVGTVSSRTGVWAFLNSRSILKLVPKLIIAPGYTSVRPANGVASVNLTAGGSGYNSTTTTVTFSAPQAVGGRQAQGTTQVVGGAVTGITVTDPGFGYTTAPTVTVTGAGAGALGTAVSSYVANPVGIAMASIVDRLRAFGFVDGPGTNYTDAIAYRNDYGSQRIMVIDPGVLGYDTTTSAYVSQPASAYAAGLQASIDNAKGYWYPFSNNPINNVGGSTRPIDWSISDASCEANIMNQNQVTTIVHDDGYRFWGLRGTGTDSLWAQMSVRRTADMIYEALEASMRAVMDKPFSYTLLREVQNSVNSFLATLKARGALIGGTCWIDATLNTPSTFANGELYVNFDLEPAASLEHLIFQAARNPDYYSTFVETFAQTVTTSS